MSYRRSGDPIGTESEEEAKNDAKIVGKKHEDVVLDVGIGNPGAAVAQDQRKRQRICALRSTAGLALESRNCLRCANCCSAPCAGNLRNPEAGSCSPQALHPCASATRRTADCQTTMSLSPRQHRVPPARQAHHSRRFAFRHIDRTLFCCCVCMPSSLRAETLRNTSITSGQLKSARYVPS